MKDASRRQLAALLCGTWLLAGVASGQTAPAALRVRTLAEVESKIMDKGHEIVRLIPASRVVPGDLLMYTLEIRNAGSTDAVAATVVRAIPDHTSFVADSAAGPGTDVTFSADGGRTFDRPENLHLINNDGTQRMAKASDYTHIRWQFNKNLKSKSVAFARFRAVVK